MGTYILFALSGIIGIVFLLKYLLGPFVYINTEQNEINRYLYILLYRGFNNGSMLVYDENLQKYIFFAKYMVADKIGINMHFPIYKDLIEKREMLKKTLTDRKFKFFFEKNDEEDVVEILIVDFNQDIDLMKSIFQKFFIENFGFENTLRIDISFRGVSEDPKKAIGFDIIPRIHNFDLSLPVTRLGYLLRGISTKIVSLFIPKNKK